MGKKHLKKYDPAFKARALIAQCPEVRSERPRPTV